MNTGPSGYEPGALAAELHWRIGGGGRTRTFACGDQKPVPYHLGYAPIDGIGKLVHKTQTPAETRPCSKKLVVGQIATDKGVCVYQGEARLPSVRASFYLERPGRFELPSED